MSSFPTYRFSILIRPKENSGYFTYFITCFKAPCFVFMGPFCGFHPDLSESYSVWPLKYSMLLQQSQFSSTREMNQLMYPWPFATCKIYGAIGSLCTVLLGLAQYVWAKSNLKISLFHPTFVHSRGESILLSIHPNKKKSFKFLQNLLYHCFPSVKMW